MSWLFNLLSRIASRVKESADTTIQAPSETAPRSTTDTKSPPTSLVVDGAGTTDSIYKESIPKTLNEKQALFLAAVGDLLHWCNGQGIQFIFGEAHRPPEMAAIYAERGTGIAKSLHTKRLAVDLIRFKDGAISWEPEDYREMGEKWESMSIMAAWGGRFNDYGHISFSHEGIK